MKQHKQYYIHGLKISLLTVFGTHTFLFRIQKWKIRSTTSRSMSNNRAVSVTPACLKNSDSICCNLQMNKMMKADQWIGPHRSMNLLLSTDQIALFYGHIFLKFPNWLGVIFQLVFQVGAAAAAGRFLDHRVFVAIRLHGIKRMDVEMG